MNPTKGARKPAELLSEQVAEHKINTEKPIPFLHTSEEQTGKKMNYYNAPIYNTTKRNTHLGRRQKKAQNLNLTKYKTYIQNNAKCCWKKPKRTSVNGRTSQGHGPENSLEVWLFGSMEIPSSSSTGPGISREAVGCYDEGLVC